MFATRSTRAPVSIRLAQFAFPLFAVALATAPVAAQGRITTPKEHFGFNIGDDYNLATYTQFMAYWRKIDAESPRRKISRTWRVTNRSRSASRSLRV
jgi:hypothetical protein